MPPSPHRDKCPRLAGERRHHSDQKQGHRALSVSAPLLIANLPGQRQDFVRFAWVSSDPLTPGAHWGAEDPSAPAGSGADGSTGHCVGTPTHPARPLLSFAVGCVLPTAFSKHPHAWCARKILIWLEKKKKKRQTSPKLSPRAKSANAGKIPAPSANQHLPSSSPGDNCSVYQRGAPGQDVVSQGPAGSPGAGSTGTAAHRVFSLPSPRRDLVFRRERDGRGTVAGGAGGFAKQQLLRDPNI